MLGTLRFRRRPLLATLFAVSAVPLHRERDSRKSTFSVDGADNGAVHHEISERGVVNVISKEPLSHAIGVTPAGHPARSTVSRSTDPSKKGQNAPKSSSAAVSKLVHDQQPTPGGVDAAGEQKDDISLLAPAGTIAVLVKPDQLATMKRLLIPSLLRNIRFETPITFMYEGRFDEIKKMVFGFLQGHHFLRPVNFVNVSKYFIASKEEIALMRSPDARMKSFGMLYRKMCEFWAKHAYALPAFKSYRYLWRLDTDSNITEPVVTNLYDTMNTNNAVFGYLVLQQALPEACQGLQNATEAFFNSSVGVPISADAKSFLHDFEQRKCPHWNTNFEILDLDFFRGSRIHARYTKFLANPIHGFVKYRWGDHVVQTLSVLMQVPPSRTLCMKPWVPGYHHQGRGPNCDASLKEPNLVRKGGSANDALTATNPSTMAPASSLPQHASTPVMVPGSDIFSNDLQTQQHFPVHAGSAAADFGEDDVSLTAPTGTIVVLVKADRWPELNKTLAPSLLRNVHFATPVTIMFEGGTELAGIMTEVRTVLQGNNLLRPVSFVNVSEYFAPSQEEVALLRSPDARMKAFGMSYRKTGEFWARHVYAHPSLKRYRYLWRLGVDSRITQTLTTNLYDAMNSNNAVIGYLLLQQASPEACRGLQRATESFFKADTHFTPPSAEAQVFLRNFEQRKCPSWNTNFEIMDLDFFRGSRIHKHYTKFLGSILHGFVRYRWGDHIVQTLSVLLQVPPSRTLCMKPWVPGYAHKGQMTFCNATKREPELLQKAVAPDAELQSRGYRYLPMWCIAMCLLFAFIVRAFAAYKRSGSIRNLATEMTKW